MARGDNHLATVASSCTWLFLLLLLPSVGNTKQNPRYEFQIDYKSVEVSWQICPKNWTLFHQKCYKIFYEQVSWQEASLVCKSLGGHLAEVIDFNQNQGLGLIIKSSIEELKISNSDLVSSFTGCNIWIGLKRTGDGVYKWSNGKHGLEKQGFWDQGNPPEINDNVYSEHCCDIGLNTSSYGEFRWHLSSCEKKQMFVCEVDSCERHQFFCANGYQCVYKKYICDGQRDCDDGSDETNCSQDNNGCGGVLDGFVGTFHSPGYPSQYSDFATCVWKVQTPVGTRVQLQFESFETELKYDSVEVFDGSSSTLDRRLGRYDGQTLPLVPLAASNVILVVFTSDLSNQAAGFNATWFSVTLESPAAGCGGQLIAAKEIQWFTSPFYASQFYPDNLVCDWIISTNNTSDIINIQFQDFKLESSGDWLEIRDGPLIISPLFGRFSGTDIPPIITSTNSSLFVRLKADLHFSLSGFNASYMSGCEMEIFSYYSKFSSPGYGVATYPHRIMCSWKIVNLDARKLTLVFGSSFDTESDLDVVQVYNSSRPLQSSLVAELSGDVPTPFRFSISGAVYIQFTTDESVQRLGWTAAFSYDCNNLIVSSPLMINTTDVHFGTAVRFSCEEGYLLVGSLVTICDIQGVWRPSSLPTCQVINCGSPSIPKYSYLVSLSHTTFGGVAVYTCWTGYEMVGSGTCVCTKTGWKNLPRCEEIFCPKRLPPLNGTAKAEDNRFSSVSEFFCKKGYHLAGAKFSHCTANGFWTSEVPQCHLMECPPIVGIKNGQVKPAGPVQTGEQVIIHCDDGYTLDGAEALTCTSSLDYDKPIPVCRDIDECAWSEVRRPCGEHTCQNVPGGFRCACKPGFYHPEGNFTICQDMDECTKNNGSCNQHCINTVGSYSCLCIPGYILYNGTSMVVGGVELIPGKTCISPCQPLMITDGRMIYTGQPLQDGSYLHPAEAIILCRDGFIADGPTRLYCQVKDGWSAEVSSCEAQVCPHLEDPMSGVVVYDRLTVGSMARYTCNEGYRLKGPSVRFCQIYHDPVTHIERILWTSIQPVCKAVDCGPPPEPVGGGLVFYLSTILTSAANYSCYCGYELQGSLVRFCQTSGTWSGNNSYCIAQSCSQPGQPLFGSMLAQRSGFAVDTMVYFQCERPGYKLTDPWPIKCVFSPTYIVSAKLPVYHALFETVFMSLDLSNISSICGKDYQILLSKNLTEFTHRLQDHCNIQHNLSIDITIIIDGPMLVVSSWIEMASNDSSNLGNFCDCGQRTVKVLDGFWRNRTQFQNTSLPLGCPLISPHRTSLNMSMSGWHCPQELELQEADGDCGEKSPSCMEATCVVQPTSLQPAISRSQPSFPNDDSTTSVPQVNSATSVSPYTSVTNNPTHVQIQEVTISTSVLMERSTQTTIKDVNGRTTTELPLARETSGKFALPTSQETFTVTQPLYIIEVTDQMEGSFKNVTCLDQVHLIVNNKVNELLRDFLGQPGSTCLNASDIKMELLSGKISFKGTQASIFIQYSLKYTSSPRDMIERCAMELQNFVIAHLPVKFELVENQIVPHICQHFGHRSASMNISGSRWDCQQGYVFDRLHFQCNRNNLTSIPISITTISTVSPFTPPTPRDSMPTMVLTFAGTFVSKTDVTSECLTEYTVGLKALLRDLEPHVQNFSENCENIYVDITDSLNLTKRGNKIDVTSQVILMALTENVVLPSQNECADFVRSKFEHPLKHFSNVTLPATYLHNCSPITLEPAWLASDPENVVSTCPESYIYDHNNYRCVDESLPSYAIVVNLTFSGMFTDQSCMNSLQESAKIMAQEVLEDIQQQLLLQQLCNISPSFDHILLLPRSVNLTTTDQQAQISISFALVNLDGQESSVNECKMRLYPNLTMAIASPVRNMFQNVSSICLQTAWPNNYTVVSEKWVCFGSRVYNPQTHTCDRQAIVEESITRTKGLKSERIRRETPKKPGLSNGPYWNSSLPACVDRQPPLFSNCPTRDVEIRLGLNGPIAATIPMPRVADNSGSQLRVTYQPDDFQLPYFFRENMTVNISAVDAAGNVAVCRINIVLIDITPPAIKCPSQTYQHYYLSRSSYVALIYPNELVIATDYMGVSSIVFNPPAGTSIRALQVINVTATVSDFSGHTASCSFLYLPEVDLCPLWTLQVPEHGHLTCSDEADGYVGLGDSCEISCNRGYQFLADPPPKYTCSSRNTWTPRSHSIECAAISYPDYDLDMSLNFTIDSYINSSCADKMRDGLLFKLTPFFSDVCKDFINFLLISNQHMAILDRQANQFISKMKVIITLNTTDYSVDAAGQCGRLIKTRMDNYTFDIYGENCGNATLILPTIISGQNTCKMGSIHKLGFCLECPLGTYFERSVNACTKCPPGFYQKQTGQVQCMQCPPGSSTAASGAKSVHTCYVPCASGSYSESGLQPCYRCPQGSYQPSLGATECLPCDSGTSTEMDGAIDIRNCTALCDPGYYSVTGLQPCFPCPQNYYANSSGSIVCSECLPTLVTESLACTSSDCCLVIDQCANNPCQSGGTCIDYHRTYHCLCPPGVTGSHCDIDIEECDSSPCTNGGTCKDGMNTFTCLCPPGYEGRSCEFQTDECYPNPCLHGHCMDAHLGYSCICYEGFQGIRCDINIDDCAELPCLNDGLCVDLVADYQCACTGTGFEGKHCENNIEDCSIGNCVNSGTCVDLINDFICECPSGFTGNHCETNIDDCLSHPCSYNGFCLDGIGSFSCICKLGYTGVACETEIDECLSSPCLNNATCKDLINDYICNCPAGFEGKNCEIDTDDCASSPCNPVGTERCEDGVHFFICHCLESWQGFHCEYEADPCLAFPCSLGATCNAFGQQTVCLCPPDFTGTLCDVQINDCQAGPCMNNGSCTDGINSFLCQCAPGFTGTSCEINFDECLSSPCQNGATCRDLINGFACRCSDGYQGYHCEEDVDDCVSQPCVNDGQCIDLVNNFSCQCPKGYKGKTCDEDIDECEDVQCANGGTCINFEGNFSCKCPSGFSGHLCQVDSCLENNTCQNGATCHTRTGKIICLCPPAFTGIDCGKEKTGDYDLWFHGVAGSACRPPPLTLTNRSEMSLYLWLRFDLEGGRGTFLTLTSSNENDATDYVLLDMTGNTVSVSLFDDSEPQRFEMSISDGKWHHIFYQWSQGRHFLYIDGLKAEEEIYGQFKLLPEKVRLSLGQSAKPSEKFQGEISQVHIFSRLLAESQIQQVGFNCSVGEFRGDVYSWPVSDFYLQGHVTVVEPALCGSSRCPSGFHQEPYCDKLIDRIPPSVKYCPADLAVTNQSVLVSVIWEQPVFEDNVGIVNIQQTHRSGQALPHGEYAVTYIAYDAENNSAVCSFRIIIKPFDCPEPPAPVNGAKVCGTWLKGRYCSISCLPSYAFVELPPPFYICGRLGFWDPPRGIPFHFPPCTHMKDPSTSLIGHVSFKGPQCSEEFKLELKEKFILSLTELNATQTFCHQVVGCDFENGLEVVCSEGGRIKRSSIEADYRVAINLHLKSSSSVLSRVDNNWMAEHVATAMKQGWFSDDKFIALPSTLQLILEYRCATGQVLHALDKGVDQRTCLDCPPGYYYSNASSECKLCPEGSYTIEPRQLQCHPCPPGTTTLAPGSNLSSDCFAVCAAGSYYSTIQSQCTHCPRGTYQDVSGETSCKTCPIGQSTQNEGASSVEMCTNTCRLGQEINGDGVCQPCLQGLYQDDPELPMCVPCPYGWTTDGVGSTTVTKCNVVVCERGHRWILPNHCELCPRGTYQPTRGADHCLVCGVGLATPGIGTISYDHCQPGPVDECETGIHRCSNQAKCTDTDNAYTCTCNFGFIGNGFDCTDQCLGYCSNHGVCDYSIDGQPLCNCENDFTGPRCQDNSSDKNSMGGAVAGSVAGSIVAVIVISVASTICYWRHRNLRKHSQDRIYRSPKAVSSAGFYNEGYESMTENTITPSHLLHEQDESSSSSASMAPRWNRSTFNSNEVPVESTQL